MPKSDGEADANEMSEAFYRKTTASRNLRSLSSEIASKRKKDKKTRRGVGDGSDEEHRPPFVLSSVRVARRRWPRREMGQDHTL